MQKEYLTMPLYTGWFKVWRQTFAHALFANDTFSRREAWFDLIGQAAFEGPEIGTLTASLRCLASRWRWSIKAVRHYLQTLEKKGMISRKIGAQVGAQVGAHLTICNYTEYQSVGHTLGHSEGPKDKKRRLKKVVLPKEGNTRGPTGHLLAASAFFEAYQALAAKGGIAAASGFDLDRRKALQARLAEHGPDSWRALLANVEASAFLQGRSEAGRKSFGIDWFLKKANYRKVIEGTYGNGAHAEESFADRMKRALGEASHD